ncbi:MAG: pseudouridine synthase [Azoarcus sp.]|nr:pseudouridine synthase [Azoarcus sp.]
MSLSLTYLHADAAIVVVIKPSGLLSVPGRGPEKADCLVARVQADFPDALAVHRLDMETSGLVVLARNKAAHRHVSMQFQNRAVEKRYLAVVDGLIAAEAGEIDLPLSADWPNRPRQKVDIELGKPSLTRYRVLSHHLADGSTRIELEPMTGRTHQLRIHLMSSGHPILGDPLYASPSALAKAERLLLHASSLHFSHPDTGTPLAFVSPAPF